ncbi:MAG: hypothetical protein LBM93_04385 [Oscillospiraceae bacterium]|jgi:flagellar basal body P-ring protein FlgI|nr:hypothetical protein [Oscillospiraceae bacterium]
MKMKLKKTTSAFIFSLIFMLTIYAAVIHPPPVSAAETNSKKSTSEEVKFTAVIPKQISLTSNREKNKFQVKIDTTQPFSVDDDTAIAVVLDKNSGEIVSGDNKISYILTSSPNTKTPIENKPLAEFDMSFTSKNVYVDFDRSNTKYDGKYSDTIDFHFFYKPPYKA